MRHLFILLVILLLPTMAFSKDVPTSPRAERAITKVAPALKQELRQKGLRYGSPIFIRIFKDPGVLEVWVENNEGTFSFFKSYDICYFSGELGPKTKEGDRQSPEGFYFVGAKQLNPWSRFHLSFNLGYPNQYDRFHGRTGSALMVHGNCVSIGCYAMTNKYINNIYALAVAALKEGQPFFRVHIFPFKLESDRLVRYKNHKWYDFWQNLKTGYVHFNRVGRPPNVEVNKGQYVFNDDRR